MAKDKAEDLDLQMKNMQTVVSQKTLDEKKKATVEKQKADRLKQVLNPPEEKELTWSANAQGILNLMSDLALTTTKDAKQTILDHADVFVNLCTTTGEENALSELKKGVSKTERIFLDAISATLAEMAQTMGTIAKGKNQTLNEQTVKKILSSKELSPYYAKLKKDMEEGIAAGEKELISSMHEATGDIFDQLEGMGMPSLFDAPDQNKEEKAKADRNKMDWMQANLLYNREKGQGKFIQLLAQGYYENAAPAERRLMLSYIIKDFKKDQKKKTEKQQGGHYFASALKGAGPLMQKMMQGVAERMVIPELQEALSVVKSDLGDIAPAYVKQVLEEVKTGAGGKITDITIEKPLGAASVAQTFLCTTTDKKGREKEVVIKIRRPDAFDRMKKEEAFIRKCAKYADMNEDEIRAYEKKQAEKPLQRAAGKEAGLGKGTAGSDAGAGTGAKGIGRLRYETVPQKGRVPGSWQSETEKGTGKGSHSRSQKSHQTDRDRCPECHQAGRD